MNTVIEADAMRSSSTDTATSALVVVGRALQQLGYRFVTVTPDTHARVNQRAEQNGFRNARDLRDVFGWNRPFQPELLPRAMLLALERADAVATEGAMLRSRVRYSSLGHQLFVHSWHPTTDPASVFFGPDTYRFCALLQRWVPLGCRLVDVGCGTGAGGMSVADRARTLVLGDINARALALSMVNATLNRVRARAVFSDVLENVTTDFDCVIANPPYMRDTRGRLYRDGGGPHGEALAVRIVREGLARLRSDGVLIVYTGSAIVSGTDTFLEAVLPALQLVRAHYEYLEVDPDVFSEELDQPGYEDVERIAVVALRAVMR